MNSLRIAAHMDGRFDEQEVEKKERKQFGTTLSELRRQGYKVEIVVKDKHGEPWCAAGRLRDLRLDIDRLEREQTLRRRFTDTLPNPASPDAGISVALDAIDMRPPVVGPVVLMAADTRDYHRVGGTGEGGCGHTQLVLIGPSFVSILGVAIREPPVRAVLERRGNCRICGSVLRGIVVFIVGDQDFPALNQVGPELGRIAPLIVYLPKDTYRFEFPGFTDEEIEAARRSVVYNWTR